MSIISAVYLYLFQCLLSPSALALISKYISHHEATRIGLQWHNMWVTPINGDTFSAAAGFYSLVASIPFFIPLIVLVELAKSKSFKYSTSKVV